MPAMSCGSANTASMPASADGRLELSRQTVEHPDATIETDPGTLAGVLWHGRSVSKATRAGDIKFEGDRTAVDRFLGLFPLPEPA